jgi:AcrR family transcriptional regulator
MSERKRLSAEERKPAILRAFYQVIEEEGFENASIAKVAKLAGVHASLIIHYFGTKERMVLELVDDVLRTYAELIKNLPQSGEPQDRLERLLGLIWSREWQEAASFSVVFSFLALSQRDREVMSRVRILYQSYRKYLMAQIAFFAEAKIINVDSVQAAVQALISLSEGSHYFCRFHIHEEDFDGHCANMMCAAKRILGVVSKD